MLILFSSLKFTAFDLLSRNTPVCTSKLLMHYFAIVSLIYSFDLCMQLSLLIDKKNIKFSKSSKHIFERCSFEVNALNLAILLFAFYSCGVDSTRFLSLD